MARSSVVIVSAAAPIPTSLSINISPASGIVPFDIYISGVLTALGGVWLAGRSVQLYLGTQLFGGQDTGGIGDYGFRVTISSVGTTYWHVQFAGDASYNPSTSATIAVTATGVPPPLTPTSVSIAVNPVSGIPPFTANIYGGLIDNVAFPLGGKIINLYHADASGNPILPSIATTTTSAVGGAPPYSGGMYAFTVSITTAGTYRFVVEFPGDATYAGCAEHDGTISVGGAPDYTLLVVAGGLAVIVLIGWEFLKKK